MVLLEIDSDLSGSKMCKIPLTNIVSLNAVQTRARAGNPAPISDSVADHQEPSEKQRDLAQMYEYHVRAGHVSPERIYGLYRRIHGENTKVTVRELTEYFKKCSWTHIMIKEFCKFIFYFLEIHVFMAKKIKFPIENQSFS